MAPETGEYRFVIHTEHATRLWLNDKQQPLIDAWVKSGDETEYEAELFLVAGRVYSLKLEFTKAKQGVDDSKKRKGPPPSKPASIKLLWKRPRGALEPIPDRHMAPHDADEVFVCDTPFPPDDRSYGWERGTAISEAWERATTDGAIQAARYVADHINRLTGTREGDKNREERVKAFCRTFADRAFRRPLTDKQAAVADRQAVRRSRLHRSRRQTRGAVDPQDAAVSVSGNRRAGPVRRRLAAVVRAVGFPSR